MFIWYCCFYFACFQAFTVFFFKLLLFTELTDLWQTIKPHRMSNKPAMFISILQSMHKIGHLCLFIIECSRRVILLNTGNHYSKINRYCCLLTRTVQRDTVPTKLSKPMARYIGFLVLVVRNMLNSTREHPDFSNQNTKETS